MKIPPSQSFALLLGLTLAVLSARADVIAEWRFTDLKPGEQADKVRSAISGGEDLTQPTDYRAPYVVDPKSEEHPGSALEFYSDQKLFLQAPADGPYNFDEEPFAVELLVKFYTYAPTDQTVRQIVMKRAKTGTYPGYSIGIGNDGRLVMAIATEGKPAKVIKSRMEVPLDEWMYIAAVRTEDGRMELYVNGDRVGEGLARDLSLKNDSDLFIGKHSGAENPGFYFDGLIQAIRISKDDVSISSDGKF